MKSVAILICAILLMAPLTLACVGCGGSTNGENAGANKRNIARDMAGREVHIPPKIDSVIGLWTAQRFLIYLDAAEMLAGINIADQRVVQNDEPNRMPWSMAIRDKILDLPAFDHRDMERILALDTDLIIACQAADAVGIQDEAAIQSRTRIPVFIVRPYPSLTDNKNEFDESVRLLGRIIDREERAEKLISGVNAIIADLRARTHDIPDGERPTVYVGGKSYQGSHGLLSTCSMYSAFDLINARNVAADIGLAHAFIDTEALLAWDPDIIFIESSSGYEMAMRDLRDPKFQHLKAIRNGYVHRIFLKINRHTNYENVLINAYYIGSVLYPDRFSDVDIAEKADEIYELFVGKPIYSEAVEVYGVHSKIDIQN